MGIFKNKINHKEKSSQISIEREEHKKEIADLLMKNLYLFDENERLKREIKILKTLNEGLTEENEKLRQETTIKQEVVEKMNLWLEENELQIINKYPKMEKDITFDIVRNVEIIRYLIPQFEVIIRLEK